VADSSTNISKTTHLQYRAVLHILVSVGYNYQLSEALHTIAKSLLSILRRSRQREQSSQPATSQSAMARIHRHAGDKVFSLARGECLKFNALSKGDPLPM